MSLLLLNNFLTFNFHVDKLPFGLIYLISLLSFSPVINFFISDSSFEQFFFLINHNSFHSHYSLLYLEFIVLNSYLVRFFLDSILFFNYFNFLKFNSFSFQFIFKLSLMSISCFKKLLRFLISYFS